ncbi:ribonuclease D [Mangrovibrevibacter kandeliae]|uniref:ribonuclease D n=1 Tax=Mangrovibrevibacter kandeliae TaxID=2968473 RepID=UPI0021182D87|nr:MULTISPECIES: ribonuclease D [unclassified Aurantimonas]MCQ8781412.1 ribonuclease D [Aurantimonas sp. CSK15Z-1]MCW4114193.1 ribonuclease D [Aurantimonas sp. MSK8Z-1]
MITTTGALEEACEDLARAEFVTVDTEFIRETTFWPELCLIQVASDALAVLIDPLVKGIDLSPFFALMADPSVMKVFHAARQDLEIVYKLGELIPQPLFDTQVAAMVCGFGESIAYDQLVARTTDARIDKTSRFTDWRHRPLSEQQLSYALADVTHLRDVYRVLKASLEQDGRSDWLAEEMAILSDPATYDLHPDDAWTRLKLRVKKPIELAIMKEVAAWREREARSRNQPRGRVLKDDAIYEIAQQAPKDEQALGRLRTIPRGFERSQTGQEILAAVARALAIPKGELPSIPRPPQLPEGTAAGVEFLRVLLKIVAEEERVAAKMIASGDDLEQLSAKGADADVPALSGWRRQLFGERALELLDGRTALCFRDRKVAVVPLDAQVAAAE